MDGRKKSIQQLLRPPDTCLLVVQGCLLGLPSPEERLCAIVKHEARQECALFLFTVDRLVSPPTCAVDSVYPIRGGFSAQTQVIRGGHSQVLVTTGDGSSLVLELPQDQFTPVFVSQLQKAVQQHMKSSSVDSSTAFDWLQGYEWCQSGWDRFSKPGQTQPSIQTHPLIDFGAAGAVGDGETSLSMAFPEKWPWSHIITPNQDGSTDIATCEDYGHGDNDLSEFDPLCQKPEPKEAVGITVTDPTPTPTPTHTHPTQNPFHSSSSNPFASSPTPSPTPTPSASPSFSPTPSDDGPLKPGSEVGMRGCISDSNLLRLETEFSNQGTRQDKHLMTRSQENLTSVEEERHCVAVGGREREMGGSDNSLSEEEEGGGGFFSESYDVREKKRRRGRWRRGERRTASAGRPNSEFEVISEKEAEESAGRSRLQPSPNMKDVRKSRDSVLKFLNPSGSKPGMSKVNMESPEFTVKHDRNTRKPRSGSKYKGQSTWISRYRPGVPVPVMSARESIMQAELRQKEKLFCTSRRLRIFCGTWNVNGKPAPSSLDQFLLEYEGQGEEGEGVAPTPDIYAIGFQELDLSAQALLVGGESNREEPWVSSVELTLRKAGNYHKLCFIRMVGVMLLVYINPELLDQVSDVETEQVTTGIGGFLGNKGGVAARFNLFHSSLCFVNCHFASSMEEVDKRNQDYYTIRNKMLFDKVSDYQYSIMEHDMVFWIGDMNYRIQTSPEMTVDVIKAHADNFQITTLLENDQLVTQRNKGTIFPEFAEGIIDFKPTYKYDPNTDQWDTSEKHRPPAWCDRVLYYGMGVELRGYRSHPKMKISDHKPVSAVFNCDMRVVNPKSEKEILEDITRKLDKLENDTLPQVDLSATEFIFTDVKFQTPQFKRLVVTNTGMRPVLVSFIPKLDQETYCKPWLEAKPASAVVQPLHDVMIVLTVCVDCDTAPALNAGQDTIEDILVLHLEGGKDFFISISGNYIVSCFGSSLEALVHLHTYIREVPVADLLDISLTASWDTCTLPQQSSSSSSSSPRPPSPSTQHILQTTPALDLPKELFRMVDFLTKHGMKEESLFQEGGRQVEMEQIRDVLDVGGKDLPGTPHSVAASLLLFLSALAEPVIPRALHQRAMDCSNQPLLCQQLLLQLPKVHQRTFVFLITFMQDLLKHSEENGLDPKLLATIFGDVLLYTPMSERRTKTKRQLSPVSRRKTQFVYQFLVNELTKEYH